MRIRGYLLLFVALFTIVVGLELHMAGPVAADDGYCGPNHAKRGRNACQGWFTGAQWGGGGSVGNLVSGGIYPTGNNKQERAESFISIVRNYLNSGNQRNEMGAAMLVTTFMGEGPFGSRATGISRARALFPDFADLVRDYASGNYPGYDVNFFYTDNPGTNSAYFSSINDDAFHDHQNGNVDAIYFYWPGGDYSIQKSCGNLLGSPSRVREVPGRAIITKVEEGTYATNGSYYNANVSISGIGSSTDQPASFIIDPPGTYTFSASSTAESYALIGYHACNSPCNPRNAPFVAAGSFDWYVGSDQRVEVFWVYRPNNLHVLKFNQSWQTGSPYDGAAVTYGSQTQYGNPSNFSKYNPGWYRATAQSPVGTAYVDMHVVTGYFYCNVPCGQGSPGVWGAGNAVDIYIGSGQRINLYWFYRPLVNNALCQGISAPDYVFPGQSFTAQTTMYNNGDYTWWQWMGYKLGDWYSSVSWGPTRTEMPVSFVNPGSSVTFTQTHTAPNNPGAQWFQNRMLREGVEWFGQTCGKTINIVQLYNYQPSVTSPNVGYPKPGDVLPVSATIYNSNFVGIGTGVNYTANIIACTAPYPATSCTPGGGAIFSTPGAGLPNGGTATHNFNYTVPNIPDGTVVCFAAQVIPAQNLDPNPPNPEVGSRDSTPQIACHQIRNATYPYITTDDGDVHAGGGVQDVNCNIGGGQDGSINSLSNTFSKGAYIVSSSGRITNFGSNNAPGSTAATFGNVPGNVGFYRATCRPDLVREAINFTGPIQTPADPNSIVLSGTGVLIRVLGNAVIPAQVIPPNTRVTVYATGSVTIAGNITYASGPYARTALPALGIVAGGDIFINPNVTRMDGYFYSRRLTDTCNGVTGIAIGVGCTNQLVVNGLMSASGFRLKRTGAPACVPVCTPGVFIGEQVNFKGTVFLSTPPVFNRMDVSALYSGERPPLY